MSNLARKIELRNLQILESTPCFTRSEFNKKCNEIEDSFRRQYKDRVNGIMNTYKDALLENTRIIEKRYCTEMIFEFLEQMGCFEEDCEYLDEKKDRVKLMYDNIREKVNKYNTYKRPERELNKKINKLIELYDIVVEK